MKLSKRVIFLAVLSLFLIFLASDMAFSQCAMCKAAIEEKTKDKNSGLAEGLNYGILYLMSFPYIIFGVIAYFWFKNSRKESKKQDFIREILNKIKGKKNQ